LLAESGWPTSWHALAGAGLTGEEGALFILREASQVEIADLARERNTTPSTIGSILDHARAKVREAVDFERVDGGGVKRGGELKQRPRRREPIRAMSQVQMWAMTAARDACRSGLARRLREARGLSVAEASDIVGVTPSTLSKWERGLAEPSPWRAVSYGTLLALWNQEPQTNDNEAPRVPAHEEVAPSGRPCSRGDGDGPPQHQQSPAA
jgi:DNA-binding transcriptional regulator YiaG